MQAFDPFGSESSDNIGVLASQWMFLSWLVALATKLES